MRGRPILLPFPLALALLASAGCSGDEKVSDTGDGTPDACPVDSGASLGDCSECIDEKCADLIPYCVEDDDCACMLTCMRQEGVVGVEDCLTQLDLPARPTGFAQIEECVAYACPDEDECATPDDWTPPDADLECDGLGSGGLGSGTEADCGFDTTLDFDPLGDVLQLQSLEGDFCVRLERVAEGEGSLQNTSWTLLDIRIGPLGEVVHIDDPSELCWYSSHHNFQDWAHIWTGSLHYDLAVKEDGHGGTEEGHDGARRYHLYVFEEGPLVEGECPATANGELCIEGPILLYAFEP